MKEDKANGTLRYTEVQLSTGTLEAPVRRRRRRRRARRCPRARVMRFTNTHAARARARRAGDRVP